MVDNDGWPERFDPEFERLLAEEEAIELTHGETDTAILSKIADILYVKRRQDAEFGNVIYEMNSESLVARIRRWWKFSNRKVF